MANRFAAVAVGCVPAFVGGCTRDDPSVPVPVPVGAPAPPPAAGDAPNVLLIVLDDVGIDRFPHWGVFEDDPALYPPTPTLDALAARGVRFTRTYAMPLCSPSRATILTGRDPWRHGVGDALELDDPAGLSADERTLPERLRDAPVRWTTGWFGKWHLTTLADPDPWTGPRNHGFDAFAGTIGNLYAKFASDGAPQDYFDWEKDTEGAVARTTAYPTVDTVDDTLARIGAAAAPGRRFGEPWLVGVSLNAAHDPFQFPPAGLWSGAPVGPEGAPQKFHAMIEAADLELGRLLAAIPADVLDRTVVIVVGDNGSPEDSALAWEPPLHLKSSPYELGVRVPLLVAGPEIDGPAVCDRMVSVADLFPTIARIAGVPVDLTDPSEPALDGVDLGPLLVDPGGPPLHDHILAEWQNPYRHRRMIRDDRFKLVQQTGHPDELYDVGIGLVEGADLLDGVAPDALPADAAAAYGALVAALPSPL